MARVIQNLFTEGLSGSVGNKQMVFSQRGGETIVSKSPTPSGKEATPAQKMQQLHFQQAVIYGKAVLTNGGTKALYESRAKRGQSAFTVALADFLNAPRIDEIDLTNYTGAKGSTIRVRCVDDFQVSSVYVKIENGDGSVADEGNAVLASNGLDWIFTASKVNPDLVGDKITVTATDKPGNETVDTKPL